MQTLFFIISLFITYSALLAQDLSQDSLTNSAQDSPQNPPHYKNSNEIAFYDLGHIEKIVQNAVDSNTSVSIVSSEDMDDSASNDIASALRYTPSVFYMPYKTHPRGEPEIYMRGFSSEQIGLFLDGIPIHSIFDRRTDLAQITSFGISEIAISKGYTSPQFGMNTLGGALNLITQKPLDSLESSLKYTFISNNENQAHISLGTNQGTYYLQGAYSFTNRNSLPLPNTFSPSVRYANFEMRNSFFQNHTLRLKAGFSPNESHEYTLNMLYERGKKGVPQNLTHFPHYDKITAYLLGSSYFSDFARLETRLYYDRFYNELNAESNAQNSRYHSFYDDFALGLIETATFNFGESSNVKFGANIKWDNHHEWDIVSQKPHTRYGEVSASIFAEFAHRFSELWRVMISASYDRADMVRSVREGVKQDKTNLQGGSAQGIVFIDWDENATSWVNVGYKSLLPTMLARFSSNLHQYIPNPSAKPENALNVELGTKAHYDTSLGGGGVEFAIFYNNLTNMFVRESGHSGCLEPDSGGCYKMVNVKNGHSYGIEISANQGFWDDRINLALNYTYTQKQGYKSRNVRGILSGETINKILNHPNHIANLKFSITPLDSLEFIANFAYQSPQFLTQTSKNSHIFLLDFKVNHRIIAGLQLFFGLTNALDCLYYYGKDSNNEPYYMAGRRVFVGLEWKY